VAGAGDGGDVDVGVIEELLDLVRPSQDEDVLGVLVREDNELRCLPSILNLKMLKWIFVKC